MRYTEGSLGRIFVLRLEDGDPLNATVEAFAREHGVRRGLAFYVGGGAPGTSLVVGPDATRTDGVIPLFHPLTAPHETFAVGTLFPDEAGEPYLHMHAACGREGDATVGELTAPFRVSQPAISRHLKVLERAGQFRIIRSRARDYAS